MISVTENAAEYITKAKEEAGGSEPHLRISAADGGCSGHRYNMGFDNESDGDTIFDSNGVTVVVDEESMALLDGLEIDYVTSFEGSSFVLKNPNATGGCGCGKSFSA